jgi:hypothetical protein
MKSFFDLREKTLTPAEKKKREEIAKAMEKDDPGMDMSKKMAIATAQAKKVAEAKATPCGRCGTTHVPPSEGGTCPALKKEEVEQVDELNRSTLTNYMSKASDARKHKDMPTAKVDKRYSGVAKAAKKLDKMNNEDVEQVDELKTDTLRSYIKKAGDAMKGRSKKSMANIPKRVGGTMRALDRLAGGQHAKLQPGEKGRPFATHKAKPYKAEGVEEEMSNPNRKLRSDEKKVGNEIKRVAKAPFDGPYRKKSSAVAGKHGEGPSTAKHLAKMGLKQFMNKDKK